MLGIRFALLVLVMALLSLAQAQDCDSPQGGTEGETPVLEQCLEFELQGRAVTLVGIELSTESISTTVRVEVDDNTLIELCLLDELRTRLQCRQGEGVVELVDLSPVAGWYLLQVRNGSEYARTNRLTRIDSPLRSDDREPNDRWEHASELPFTLADAVTLVPGSALGRTVGDEEDYFIFEVSGEPRLWRLEVAGEGVSTLSYLDGSGRQVQRRTAENGFAGMTNLVLLPGRHYLAVRGLDTDYELRAVPLGPPSPEDERESNDDETRAESFRFGEEKHAVVDPYDVDYYRFTLYATEHVQIEFEPEESLSLRFQLDDHYATSHDAQPGSPLVYEALLLPGDHYLRVSGNGGSSGRYRASLRALDPLDLPVDLEPNDRDHQARPLPPSLTAEGSLSRDDESDWYLLPSLPTDASIGIVGEGDVSLTFYRLDDQARHQVAYVRELTPGLTVELPAGEDLRMVVTGEGSYRIALDFGQTLSVEEDGLTVSLEAPTEPVAAYWHEGQRIAATVYVENRGSRQREVELVAVTSHYGWRPELDEHTVTLAPGETRGVPMTVELLPDARDDLDVRVVVQALPVDASAASQRIRRMGATATTSFSAQCGAPPAAPAQVWGLPDRVLGGFNVAWAGLGGEIVNARTNHAATYMIDGMVAPSTGWTGLLGTEATIRLARSGAPIAGVALNPYGPRGPDERLADFALLASDDGTTFETVLRGRLRPEPIEQVFLFDRPISASHLRIVAESSQDGSRRGFVLGELKVLTEPHIDLFDGRGADVAAAGVGGHLVWSKPFFPGGAAFLEAGAQATEVGLDLDESTVEWVVGFHNNRSARIASLEWQAASADERVARLSTVEVSISNESPSGPWQPVAVWNVATQPELLLADMPWARFVRFRAEDLEPRGRYALPQRLSIREAPVTEEYRSILGEWGQNNRQAIFELLNPAQVNQAAREQDDNDSEERAQQLEAGVPVEGQVVVGEDVDWYRITVPAGENHLAVVISGEPVLSARYRLLRSDGDGVLHDAVEESSRVTLSAFVEPGDYFLVLDEPPRSVVFAWDNSGSMGNYLDIIYQTISGFVRQVQPDREVAQLIAFEEDERGVFLLPGWSGDPVELMTALNNYDRSAGSSNAEANLLASTRALGEREGTRAIIFMTDAESNGARLNPELWSELERVRPRVFTFETSSAGSAHTQDLMQSWADVAGGYYDYARGVGDFEAGFARATCHLRRPANYQVRVATEYREPPGPGLLSVVGEGGAADNLPVEIVLDLSGSMSRRLPSGDAMVDVAKRVLIGLVDETLPEGTPFALRVYGHVRPNSCDTRLEQPLAPLDPGRVRALVNSVQPQLLSGTPLAASLLAVPADLAGKSQGASVILLTDGEESCGGDLEGAVTALRAAGVEVTLHIVAFGIDSPEAKLQFERLAELAGGRFFESSDEAGLAAAMRSALARTFNVLDTSGNVVASGTVGGEKVSLPPGIYSVQVPGNPAELFENVRVRGDDVHELKIGQRR